MKKWGFIAVALLSGVALYYFTVGKSRMVEAMRAEVNATLSVMAQQGFGVERRERGKSDETVILRFDDPEKITLFFRSQNIATTSKDIALLKGFKVAVDLHYLPDTAHTVAADIYPLTLPESLLNAKNDPRNREAITHLEEMLKRRAILLQIALDRDGSHFEGRMQDINETFSAQKRIAITMQGLTFDGEMDRGIPTALHQTLQRLTLRSNEGEKVQMRGIEARYRHTGQSLYDDSVDYNIEKITIRTAQHAAMEIAGIRARSLARSQNGLLNEEINTTAQTLSLAAQNQSILLKEIQLEMRADNLDIQALELLQNSTGASRERIDRALRQLLSKGVRLEIANFTVAQIEKAHETLQGFSAKATFRADKGFDPALLQHSPIAALDKIEAKADIALSNDLYATLALQPQMMMVLMFLPPYEKNGKKHFSFTLEKGALSLNGTRIK